MPSRAFFKNGAVFLAFLFAFAPLGDVVGKDHGPENLPAALQGHVGVLVEADLPLGFSVLAPQDVRFPGQHAVEIAAGGGALIGFVQDVENVHAGVDVEVPVVFDEFPVSLVEGDVIVVEVKGKEHDIERRVDQGAQVLHLAGELAVGTFQLAQPLQQIFPSGVHSSESSI